MRLRRAIRRRKDFFVGVMCFITAFCALTLFLHPRGTTFADGIESRMKYIIDQNDFINTGERRVQLNNTSHAQSNTLDKVQEKIRNDNLFENFTIPEFITINKYPCGQHTEILVYFNSRWDNFMKRRRLRSTWASRTIFKQHNVKFMFVLGKPSDINDVIRLKNEQRLHDDIIMGDFVDSYYNLTLKSIVAIHFVKTYCTSVKFIIKSDDDIFVNLFKVMKEILPVMHSDRNELACQVVESGKSPIVRDSKSKWYIPAHIFPNQTYLPQFCSGFMVIMTSSLMSNLYMKTKVTSQIHVDDVYMFGTLTQDISPIKFIDIKQNVTLKQDQGVERYRKGIDEYFAVNVRDIEAMEEMWSLTLMKFSPKPKQKGR
ncbi:hypothetical protein ACF0H5_010946 [Mactra antiquata]